jgi:diaminopimelate decarboxylase
MSLPESLSMWKTSPDGELLVGEIRVSEVARKHGTPLFIYDQGIVQRQYCALRNALPSRVSISYSVKANPNPAFLSFFLEQGCGLEIASGGEFHTAMAAGCVPADIIFAGPGKTQAELELVISREIGEIHAESPLEIERISAISRELGVRTRIGLRINPNEDVQGGAMRMGGRSAPFGVDEEFMDAVVRRIIGDVHLDFYGIHTFAGTQILDFRLLLAQYERTLEVARRAAILGGRPIRTVDFGGGLGVPYFAGEVVLDLDRVRSGLVGLMSSIEGDPHFANTRFVVEPGRFLVAEAGVYVARINDIKVSRSKKFLILDGGMNHHLAASGNLGQVIKRNFPMAVVNKLQADSSEPVDVVGPLCTPLDTLGRSVNLAKAEVGDLVGIFCSGAYARSASPLGFLSHATPAEVWIEGGQDFLIRRRGMADDNLRDVQVMGAYQAGLSPRQAI